MDEELTGTWIPIRSKWNGEPTPEGDLREVTLSFGDNHCAVYRAGSMIRHGTYSINADTSPREIDVCFVESDVPELIGAPLRGIFDLKRDKLTICYGMPGGDRANSFSAEQGTQQYMGEYHRSSSDPPA